MGFFSSFLVIFGFARRAACAASVAFAAWLLPVLFHAPPAVAAGWEGRIVAALRHSPQSGEPVMDPGELSRLSAQQPGQPYRRALIRDSIERLYATGRFADLQVDAREDPSGVIVTFKTKARYFVGSVRVYGLPSPPTEAQLQSATQLQLGMPFDELELPAITQRLHELLVDNGYFEAAITPDLQYHPQSQQLDISFSLQSGERARLGRVAVTGNPVFPAERLLEEADWSTGKLQTAELIQNGLNRLRELYREQNYLQTSLRIVSKDYNPETNRVDLELSVDAGTPVEVVLVGATLSRSRLNSLLPMFQEGSLDEDLLREGERNLRNYFESEGYFQVEVSHRWNRDNPERSLVQYDVVLGPRQQLHEIRITGNRYFQAEVLRERMRIQPATFSERSGRFSRLLLEQDIAAIRSLYQSNGFAQVQVSSALQPLSPDSPEDIVVSIQVEEGSQTQIGAFSLLGNEVFSEAQLLPYINASQGQPYSDSLVASDRNNLLTFYWNEGFPAARFDYQATPEDNGSLMDLQYILVEGEPESVRHIFVGGLEHTRVGIVNRQIQIRDGEPLSQGKLLDTQRRLYDLGIFSRVEISRQNPRVAESERNVLVYLEEARRYTLNLGLGGEFGRFGGSGPDATTEFSPDISIDLTRLNVGGRPHTAGIRSRFSALQRRVGLTYAAPRFLNNENLRATARAFYDDTRDVRTFSQQRLESSLQFENRRSRPTTLAYRYEFRRVRVSNLNLAEQEIPRESQPVLVGLLGFTWIRDTRDIPTDARQGVLRTADMAVAAKQLGSETSFVRSLVQHSSYHRLGPLFILARSTQFGVQAPFGKDRFVPGAASTNEIPIAEKFFSGGGSSHRGFGLNQAGPRDLETGFAIGGDALLLNSLELRFPVWRQSITGVLFHDMGNVYTKIDDLNLRQQQKNAADFSFMSHAVGLGVRYQTPVAPFRFDVGYNLNPTRFVAPPEGGGDPIEQRLSRWQFLFSVGQSF
jgi:outer membrane protein assembly complex protein YaeT